MALVVEKPNKLISALLEERSRLKRRIEEIERHVLELGRRYGLAVDLKEGLEEPLINV